MLVSNDLEKKLVIFQVANIFGNIFQFHLYPLISSISSTLLYCCTVGTMQNYVVGIHTKYLN